MRALILAACFSALATTGALAQVERLPTTSRAERQIIDNNTKNPSWTEDDLRLISCPTLLVAGENDPFATLDQMATMKRSIPGAEWLIVNNSGHPVHFEHPEIIGPRLLDFFERNA